MEFRDMQEQDTFHAGREYEREILAKRIKELEEVLIEYGSHQPGCARQWGSKYACRCGWTREKEQVLKGK